MDALTVSIGISLASGFLGAAAYARYRLAKERLANEEKATTGGANQNTLPEPTAAEKYWGRVMPLAPGVEAPDEKAWKPATETANIKIVVPTPARYPRNTSEARGAFHEYLAIRNAGVPDATQIRAAVQMVNDKSQSDDARKKAADLLRLAPSGYSIAIDYALNAAWIELVGKLPAGNDAVYRYHTMREVRKVSRMFDKDPYATLNTDNLLDLLFDGKGKQEIDAIARQQWEKSRARFADSHSKAAYESAYEQFTTGFDNVMDRVAQTPAQKAGTRRELSEAEKYAESELRAFSSDDPPPPVGTVINCDPGDEDK